ncbi:MAG TPA: hypothetical protein VLA74_13675 [Nitrososphaeraceae archaeon]|nr:hypothetical protein [Nitrososphaeraceae archaeon]
MSCATSSGSIVSLIILSIKEVSFSLSSSFFSNDVVVFVSSSLLLNYLLLPYEFVNIKNIIK